MARNFPDSNVEEICRWMNAAEAALRRGAKVYATRATRDAHAEVRGHFENAKSLLSFATNELERAAKIMDVTPGEYLDEK